MGRDDDREKRHRHGSHRRHGSSSRRDDDGSAGDDSDGKKDRGRQPKKDHHNKRKEESRRKRRDEDRLSEDDDNDDEERRRHRKKHRRDSKDEEERRSKKDRKSDDRHSKKKKKKSSKKKRHGDDDSSSSDSDHKHRKKSKRGTVAPQKPDKSKLHSMGDAFGRAPDTLINPETDYFTYHQEFSIYLYREEGIRFNDLTSEEAREAFGRFSKQYNSGKLEAPYYDNPPTFPPQVLDESKTTQHKWAFQTSETERRGLVQLQEGVRRLTQYKDDKAESSLAGTKSTNKGVAKGPSIGPAPNDAEHHRPQQKTPEERVEERRTNRRLREHVRTAQEDVTGGAKDFRERQIEKRKDQAARIHGAARDKEEGTGVELNDDAVYGQGDSSFQTTLARQRQSKARREEKRNSRVEELQNKERERQENMLKMLGLDAVKPGQKISIAPRKDG
jgi:hypothetical protein